MGDARAFALPEDQEIHIGLSLHDEIALDTAEARFDGIHELVHVVFHRGAPRFFRKSEGNVVYAFLHDHERAEWQADRIARAIFMPPAMVSKCRDVLKLAELAGVPIRQAIERIRELDVNKERKTPVDIELKLAVLKREAAQGTTDFHRYAMQEIRLRLWNELPTIEGEDPANSRRCGDWRILWNEFGKTTECGWFIENGRIYSYFASRHR
jgi:Zn-dependent peptidase ImmA (M78 family)